MWISQENEMSANMQSRSDTYSACAHMQNWNRIICVRHLNDGMLEDMIILSEGPYTHSNNINSQTRVQATNITVF